MDKKKRAKNFRSNRYQSIQRQGNDCGTGKKLAPNAFVQINRSVIINLRELLNYSFWENDKYIVRMKDSDKEFVMSRLRLKKIKDKLL